MAAVAELVAVISKTTVQTLIQAPPAIEGAEIERLCVAAVERACISLAQEAEAAAAKPKLQLVADNDAPKTAIHMQTRDVPLEKRRQIVADVTGLDMDDDGPTETGDVGPDGEDPIERELP
jgi:hypothetical protein